MELELFFSTIKRYNVKDPQRTHKGSKQLNDIAKSSLGRGGGDLTIIFPETNWSFIR